MTIILLGSAGSGKGTQAAQLIEKYNLQKIEAGDLIRDGAKEDTTLGKYLHEIHASGQHVTDGVIRDLINEKLKAVRAGTGLLFDGYPRSLMQAKDLDVIFEERNISNRQAVWINVPDDVSRERLLHRSICTKCKTILATREVTECPTCGGPMEVRDYDQDITAINKRLQWFHDKVIPAIDFYRDKGMLNEVDGVGTPDEIFARIVHALEE